MNSSLCWSHGMVKQNDRGMSLTFRDFIKVSFGIETGKKNNMILLFLLLCSNTLCSQNKEMLYDFTDIPQSLLLNPGADTNFNYHIGIPVLSHIHLNAGI